ncbi:zinc finger, CCHC-type, retrotransposon gag domain protein [Tanacetum coccineum]
MVNTRTDAELAAAVQAAVDAMLPQIREQVREEYRTGAVGSGSNPPPVTIHTWLERFNKQKPRSFEKAVAPVDAENWISHMEKIFDVMDCNDAFKTRLAVYKFEGDALAWWKAYKQAKGGDAWVLTLTWAAFKELFFLQFFPRAEQERLKREYHSIRQRASENSTEYMQRFLRLAGFLGQAAGYCREQAKNLLGVADVARNLEILRDRDDYDRSERSDKSIRVETDISRHRRIFSEVHDQKDMTSGSDRQGGGGWNSGDGRDQRNRGHASQRSTTRVPAVQGPSEGYTHPAFHHMPSSEGMQKNMVLVRLGLADKKPDASGRVFALTLHDQTNLHSVPSACPAEDGTCRGRILKQVPADDGHSPGVHTSTCGVYRVPAAVQEEQLGGGNDCMYSVLFSLGPLGGWNGTLLQAALVRLEGKMKKNSSVESCPSQRTDPHISSLCLLLGLHPSQRVHLELIHSSSWSLNAYYNHHVEDLLHYGRSNSHASNRGYCPILERTRFLLIEALKPVCIVLVEGLFTEAYSAPVCGTLLRNSAREICGRWHPRLLMNGRAKTPPPDVLETIAETIISTIPRHPSEPQPTKKDGSDVATTAEPRPPFADQENQGTPPSTRATITERAKDQKGANINNKKSAKISLFDQPPTVQKKSKRRT